uniref:Pyruvate kinase n=1 Tax=Tetraselmis sp. GSL018 TaxID=582737 RepID=A0A061QK13_9CHLO
MPNITQRKVPIKAKIHGTMHHISPSSVLEPAGAFPKHFPGTKVCATLGPACHDVDTLARLLNSGMTSARVDLTWGNVEFHKRSLRNLAEACKRTKRLCGVMVDTLGREVYVKREFEHDSMGWPVSREALEFKKGHQVTLTTRDAEASSELLPVTFPGFPSMCQIGDEIFIGRYLVTGAESASCYARVVELESDASMSGLLTIFHVERSSHSVSNLQNTLPALMESDIEALRQLKDEFDIDWLCLSYARSAQDVLDARQILDELGMADTEIMAKVETRQALLEFKNILRHADGIIISRGNIGLDVQPEKMCLVQKTIISACNVVGKPVCITRVVDTMANTPRPTRAEATDVANAVLDGVDGILLGAETLRGKYPVETVKCVTSIAIQAEKNFDHQKHFEFLMDESLDESALFGEDSGLWAPMQGNIPTHLTLTTAHSSSSLSGTATAAGGVTSSKSVSSFNEVAGSAVQTGRPYLSKLESICSSAVRAAEKVRAKLIVVFTNKGRTARLVAKYRPPMPILTVVIPYLTTDRLKWKLIGRGVARQCQVVRGVCPVLAAPFQHGGEDVLREALELGMEMELVGPDDHVVCVQRLQDDMSLQVLKVSEAFAELPAEGAMNDLRSASSTADGSHMRLRALTRSLSAEGRGGHVNQMP